MSLPSTQYACVANVDVEGKDLSSLEQVPVVLPEADQILVKTEAYAANPTDWKHIVLKWADQGCIVGTDASGTVAAVGSNVTNFKVGDYVSVFIHGAYWETPQCGAFAQFCLADQHLAIKYKKPLKHVAPASGAEHIPGGPVDSFESAASMSLGVVTVSLSFSHFLKLSPDVPAPAGKIFLVWGGATATGILAIQIAKLLGWRVIATASGKHHDSLKKLGAEACFNYGEANVIEQIKKYGGEDIVRALDTVGSDTTIQQTHDAVADSATALVDNLLFKKASEVKNLKANVTITASLSYVAIGLPVNLRGGLVIQTSEELVKDFRNFMKWSVERVSSGDIKHAPIKILPGGLKAANAAMNLLKEGKTSGEKLVFVAEEY
ncbi:hypothetical protein BABINDRAFT_160075 [Babjeviella inositovora NRRL Y-12698]|uniref:Enoyl reductase (ER) domain-containing protein n=1 Tax=Babjeviella inositovora NRRL Y-12698 TaxID=984486 RepID=A0A1E3QW07_9ASCO|nr:uncharacterized protein BABINDRAFT_160075 [Babjeviella inositovora NRRL Y-12698]ODQ81843.1 hypothetical protein BABINDRAFT_160075 [Babjeviella inositovora NRRL Y-12698]